MTEETVIEQNFWPENEDHSNAYTMLQRSRWYPQQPSYYNKWRKTTLCIVSIYSTPQRMMCMAF